MTAPILLEVFLMGLALSCDAFAVSITYSLVYKGINTKRCFFIAIVFGIMQGLMPLLGYWIVELVQLIVTSVTGNIEQSGEAILNSVSVMSTVIKWLAFGLLLFVGLKMLIEAIKELRDKEEEKIEKVFSIKEVLYFGIITAIDALTTGIAFHQTSINNGQFIYTMSNNSTIFLHVAIITICTFVISLIGVVFGKTFVKIFKGKVGVAGIIGGAILIALAILVVVK